MIRVYLIRHSITKGNLKKRYIGAKTDEPLCQEGYDLLKKKQYPKVEKVIASPMKRCLETAKVLFPENDILVEEGLKECDFGQFENKNYQELSGNKAYQAWIDSNGTLPFPEGESQESFQKRSKEAFEDCIEQCLKEDIKEVAFVVHGGTIMSILSACANEERDYFSWRVKNAEGFLVEVEEKEWERTRKVTVLRKINGEG